MPTKTADSEVIVTENTDVENNANVKEETTENNVSGPTLPGFDPALLAGLELEIQNDVVKGDAATQSARKGRTAKPAVIDSWWAARLGYLYTKMNETEPYAIVFKGTAGDFRKNWNGEKSSKELWIASLAAQGVTVKVVSDATDDSPNALLPTTEASAVIHRKIRVLPVA